MGTSVVDPYLRFRRIVVTPFWCEGSPLKWWHAEARIGIGHLAAAGEVGHFNLAWWLLARSVPPKDAKVYANTDVNWVITKAARTRFGNYTLTELASFLTLTEWQTFVIAHAADARRFAGSRTTYEQLRWLALTGNNKEN